MNVQDRVGLISRMCSQLSNTSSRLDKEYIVKKFRDLDAQLSKDIDYVFEILSGMHKLGYTFIKAHDCKCTAHLKDISLEEYLRPLYALESKKEDDIWDACSNYYELAVQLAPILNRQWKIGINKSQVNKTIISPMLAKKYEPGKHCSKDGEDYYITEKLDGNRCITYYDFNFNKWCFYSRSGKELKVDFDMLNMPKDLVYDGEILSIEQLKNPGQHNFNSLSGAINSKYGDKSHLVYMIFDIVDDTAKYNARRLLLDQIKLDRVDCDNVSNTKILPCLGILNKDNMFKLDKMLTNIEDKGGEGLMINIGSATYQHKRTDKLLKVKSTYTMDMKVTSFEYGTGKYEDVVGALVCEIIEDGVIYQCKVGSGLSESERYLWASDPNKIIGKIVEVAYFSLSQDKNNQGTSVYSLRFPRFKKIRTDKDTTSIY